MLVDMQTQRRAPTIARRRRIVWGRVIPRALLVVALLVLTLTFALPFYWLLSTAVKTPAQLFTFPPIWVPTEPQWSNFGNAMGFFPFGQYLFNTLTICGATVIGTLLSNSLIAYGLSRIEWPGRNLVFILLLGTLLLPFQVTLIPLFIMFAHIGWVDTYLPLVVPAFFGNAFFMFLLRQFFLGIPRELGEAVRIDDGDRLALLAQLEITYTDGTTARVATDEGWRAATGPTLASGIYDGESYDARLERPGWSAPGYDDGDWAGVRPISRDVATLVAPTGPPVRRTEVVRPAAITAASSSRAIVDFGQNLVGRVRLTVRGEAGRTITLRHAEVLDGGELCTRPLRAARATDRYTLRGGGEETWEPRFTFHGFRYAEVEGWPGELQPDDLAAVVCHSDLERTGWFECSDPTINRLHENVVWSMRGNFLDIPTDCPQRDERLGWTGDIQVFAPTAAFLYDVAGFLSSWLADLDAEQRDAAGVVPFVVPNIIDEPAVPATAWGDAAVIVPWVLYRRFGDAGILAAQFDSMRAWVDVIAARAGETYLWDTGFQFGDWLDPAAPPDKPAAARTDPALIATAYLAHSAELVGWTAGVLGRADDEARYLALAARVRDAFAAEYVTPAGRMASDAPTAYALALEFGLLRDAAQRRRAGDRLAALARDGGYRIGAGFVGTPLILDALCDVGTDDSAYRLLTQRACPSWLYPVTMGATTIWERWDSLLPDGSVNPGEMTSFNHYALGAVADWLHRVVGGLAPAEPGYRRLDVRPRPGGGLTSARARHRTPYGFAECAWRIVEGEITIEVVIPPNATARVTLPGGDGEPVEVGSGTYRWSYPYRDPREGRPPLSLDSALVALVDDAEAWEAALRSVPDLAGVEVGLQGRGDMPLRRVVSRLPHPTEAGMALEAAFAALGR